MADAVDLNRRRGTELVVSDVGGHPVQDGRFMRKGLLFRISGALAGDVEFAHIERLQLELLVDLRGRGEDRSALEQFAGAHHIRYRHEPITLFAGQVPDIPWDRLTTPEATSSYLSSVYREILDEHGASLARGIAALAEVLPAGFGCAAGKDRTGLMAALVQALVGMDEAAIIADYVACAPDPHRLSAMLRDLCALEDTEMEGPGLRGLVRATEQTMATTFEYLEAQYGGAAAYLHANGLPSASPAILRRRLLKAP
jgi:protein-tyrosine phosphatase